MSVTYLANNKGDLVPPHPDMAHPVAASGITKTLTSANTNYTQTVEAGSSYRITCGKSGGSSNGWIWFSVTGTIATAANREYVVGYGESVIIKIPIGTTTLNMGSSVAATVVHMAKVVDA